MGQWPSYLSGTSFNIGNGIQLNVPTGIRNTNKIPYFPWTKKILNRWGKIKQLSELECGAPWELYVETLGPAAAVLIRTLIEPGKIDIIKSRLNHSYNCGFKKLFRDAEKFLPVESEGAVKFLFRITGPIFALNWYYFLADSFTEFVFNWESAVIQRQQCEPSPIGGPCQLSNANNNLVIANTWFPMNWRTKDNDPSNWAPGGAPWNPVSPGHIAAYKVYAGASFTNSTPLQQDVSLRITDGFGQTIAGPVGTSVAPRSTESLLVFATPVATSGGQAGYLASYSISQQHFSGVQVSGGSFTVAAQ